MGGRLEEDWEGKLERWLAPFLGRLRRQAQRRWAPFYLKGLILPGERKSIEPMAARVAPGDTQQLHHFVSTSPWATAPLEGAPGQGAGPAGASAATPWRRGWRRATPSSSTTSCRPRLGPRRLWRTSWSRPPTGSSPRRTPRRRATRPRS